MLCALILYVSGVTYSLTSTPSDRFFKNFFTAILLTLRVFSRNQLSGNHQRNIFLYSVLMSDVRYEPELYVTLPTRIQRFQFELYTQRNIEVGLTNILWGSLITIKYDLDFWRIFFKWNTEVFRNFSLYIFSIFSTTYTHYPVNLKNTRLHMKILLTIFLWIIHMRSQLK